MPSWHLDEKKKGSKRAHTDTTNTHTRVSYRATLCDLEIFMMQRTKRRGGAATHNPRHTSRRHVTGARGPCSSHTPRRPRTQRIRACCWRQYRGYYHDGPPAAAAESACISSRSRCSTNACLRSGHELPPSMGQHAARPPSEQAWSTPLRDRICTVLEHQDSLYCCWPRCLTATMLYRLEMAMAAPEGRKSRCRDDAGMERYQGWPRARGSPYSVCTCMR